MTPLDLAIRTMRRQIARTEAPVRRDLVRLYHDAYDNVERDLDGLMLRIQAARDAGEQVNPDWLRREARYRYLLDAIDIEMSRWGRDAQGVLATGQREAITIGTNGATAQARAAGYAVDVGASAPIVSSAQERLVTATQPGTPLADTLRQYPARTRSIIERELFTGIAEGRSPRDVARRIRRAANGPMVHARIESTARTETMRALRGSLTDQYAAIGVETVVWRCARSPETCLACLFLDGTEYPADDAPEVFHPNCRCVLSPKATPEFVAANGAIETGEGWLLRQPEPIQRDMIGNDDAYAAWRNGDIELADFVGYRHDPRWGTTVRQRGAGEVLRGVRRVA